MTTLSSACKSFHKRKGKTFNFCIQSSCKHTFCPTPKPGEKRISSKTTTTSKDKCLQSVIFCYHKSNIERHKANNHTHILNFSPQSLQQLGLAPEAHLFQFSPLLSTYPPPPPPPPPPPSFCTRLSYCPSLKINVTVDLYSELEDEVQTPSARDSRGQRKTVKKQSKL